MAPSIFWHAASGNPQMQGDLAPMLPTLDRGAYAFPVTDADVIFYQFSRAKVERGDFRHFLTLYALDKLPTGRRLRQMMDSMVFVIEGWDDDPREIHDIPEIRRFYRAFHEAWPYWLYFCNLDTDILRAMVMCCMDAIASLKVDGQSQVGVECDPAQLLRFVQAGFPHMNRLCERGKMSERLIYDRSKAVFEYFNLPFDAPPPMPRSA